MHTAYHICVALMMHTTCIIMILLCIIIKIMPLISIDDQEQEGILPKTSISDKPTNIYCRSLCKQGFVVTRNVLL